MKTRKLAKSVHLAHLVGAILLSAAAMAPGLVMFWASIEYVLDHSLILGTIGTMLGISFAVMGAVGGASLIGRGRR